MKVLVVSDIHENFHNLEVALVYAKKNNITTGFALGDYMNPGIMYQLGRSGINFHCVLGNNDGERFKLIEGAGEFDNLILEDLYCELSIDDKKVLLTHYPKVGDLAAKSSDYQAVFYGHDHKHHNSTLDNNCLLANPGEITGHIFGKPTFGVWDSVKNTFSIIEIKGDWVDVKKQKRSKNDILAGVELLEIKE